MVSIKNLFKKTKKFMGYGTIGSSAGTQRIGITDLSDVVDVSQGSQQEDVLLHGHCPFCGGAVYPEGNLLVCPRCNVPERVKT